MSRQRLDYYKTFTGPKALGAMQSGWLATGQPGPGATPPLYTAGSGYTCDNSTVGSFNLTNASIKNSMAKLSANCNINGTLMIFDRLWSCSGIGFAAGTKTITTPGALPARITDDGINAQIYAEQFVAAGAASGTLTVNYIESTTAASKAAVLPVVVSAPVIGQLQRVPLAAGSAGVSSIVDVANSATWTSGSYGLSILKPLMTCPVPLTSYSNIMDYAQLALQEIQNDSCLMLAWQAVSASAPTVNGDIIIIDANITSIDDVAAALAT